jgi:hypothetical protein
MAQPGDWPEEKLRQITEIVGDDDRLLYIKIARRVVEQYGLPRGPVVELLEEAGVDRAVIDEIATKLVPFRNT